MHKGGSVAESNATVRPNVEFACTPTGSRGSIPNILVMNVTVNDSALPAVRDLFYTTADLAAAAGSRSQQHMRLLMGAKTVDSESKWQTDHSFHQQWSQTAAAPAPWTDTFSFTVVSSPWFPLLTSPKLTPLALPHPLLPPQPERQQKGGRGLRPKRRPCSNGH